MSTKDRKKQQKDEAVEREPTKSETSKRAAVSLFENTVSNFWKKYSEGTPVKIKLVDSFILFLTSLIVWQLFYRIVSGTDFPKNAFLSGIFAPLGVITLAVAFRMHIVNDEGRMIPESQTYRALWEFMAGLVVLSVVAINFLG